MTTDHSTVGPSRRSTHSRACGSNHHPASRGRPLDLLTPPLSVAVIGASPTKWKLGNVLLRNVMRSRGVKSVHAVNPNHSTVEGLVCYPSVLDVHEKIDMAMVAVPARSVPSVVSDCVSLGVPAVIVVSSGFSEMGGEGRELEDRIRAALEGGATRLLGPNTLGYLSPSQDLDVVFLDETAFPRPRPGCIGIVSQSGSLGVDLMHEINTCGNGISTFISLGNKLDIDECDAIEHLARDDDTRSILLYIESISNGKRFLDTLTRCAWKKPIVLLKGGRSRGGSKAAVLHTGRMGGEYPVLKGVMAQTGVVEAQDEVELVDFGRCLSQLPPPRGRRTLVLTNGGGNGILAVDRIENRWSGVLQLAPLRPSMAHQLDVKLPDYLRSGNPLDLSAEASVQDYLDALRVVVDSRTVDLFIVGVTANERIDANLAKGLSDVAVSVGKPLIVYLKGFGSGDGMAHALTKEGIPHYPSVHRAVDAAGAYLLWHKRSSRHHHGGEEDAA